MYALFSHEQYTTQAPPFYQSDLNSTDNDQLEILFARGVDVNVTLDILDPGFFTLAMHIGPSFSDLAFSPPPL